MKAQGDARTVEGEHMTMLLARAERIGFLMPVDSTTLRFSKRRAMRWWMARSVNRLARLGRQASSNLSGQPAEHPSTCAGSDRVVIGHPDALGRELAAHCAEEGAPAPGQGHVSDADVAENLMWR